MFQLDHFRPKGKFPHLIDDFYNLYYACYACNHKNAKSDHWPTEELQVLGFYFVDLCHDDFETHYELQQDGILVAKTKAARYTIDTIRLNGEDIVKIRAEMISKGEFMDKAPGRDIELRTTSASPSHSAPPAAPGSP